MPIVAAQYGTRTIDASAPAYGLAANGTLKLLSASYATLAAFEADWPELAGVYTGRPTSDISWNAAILRALLKRYPGHTIVLGDGTFNMGKDVLAFQPGSTGDGFTIVRGEPGPRLVGMGRRRTALWWSQRPIGDFGIVWRYLDGGLQGGRIGIPAAMLLEGVEVRGPGKGSTAPASGMRIIADSTRLQDVGFYDWPTYGLLLDRDHYNVAPDTTDDRGSHTVLSHVYARDIGHTGLFIGAPAIYGTDNSLGNEADHVVCEACDIKGEVNGIRVWAHDFTDRGSLFVGGEVCARLESLRQVKAGKCVGFYETRFEHSADGATLLVNNQLSVILQNVNVVGEDGAAGTAGPALVVNDGTATPGWGRTHVLLVKPHVDLRARTEAVVVNPTGDTGRAADVTILDPRWIDAVALTGTVGSPPSATLIILVGAGSEVPSNADDWYNGLFLRITSGAGAGQERRIVDYAGGLKRAQLDSMLAPVPAVGDGLIVFRRLVRVGTGDTDSRVVISTHGALTAAAGAPLQLYGREQDPRPLLQLAADGALVWGDGLNAPNVALGRTADNLLEVAAGDSLRVQGLYNANLRVGVLRLWRGTGDVLLYKATAPTGIDDGFPVGWLKRTATNGDTTPLVANCQLLQILNTFNTIITQFDGGFEGQILQVVLEREPSGTLPYTTVSDNSNIKLAAGAIEASKTKRRAFTLTRITPLWVQTTPVVETDPT